jgi:hypothetical protein
MIIQQGNWPEREPLKFVEVTDPVLVARAQRQHEQATRNMDWLQAHWAELIPPNYGRYLAIAGQEAFLADTYQEAIERAQAAHPEDEGVFCWHLSPWKGPQIYAHRR